MDPKLEKYINFIISDMMENTTFNDPHRIFFHPPYWDKPKSAYFNMGYGEHFPTFKKYVMEQYGVKFDEVYLVWKGYEEAVFDKMYSLYP